MNGYQKRAKAREAKIKSAAKTNERFLARVKKAEDKSADDESMASRSIQAEIDIACGLGSDDDWLLP